MILFRFFKRTRYFVVSYAYENAPGWGFGTIDMTGTRQYGRKEGPKKPNPAQMTLPMEF